MLPRILVVEDEADVRAVIRINLEQAGFDPVPAANAEEARVALRDRLPSLVLIDWGLPGMNGVELARRLRSDLRTESLPIIMLTARASPDDIVTGLEAGADDYITKPFSPRELVGRIKALIRRRLPHMTDACVSAAGIWLDPSGQRARANGNALALGPTEFRLLHVLMTHQDRVFPRARLLDHVWGDHVFVEERTVDVHIRRLRKALQESGLERVIETVHGSGYRFCAMR